jgi:membrane peptidoglycan carboxypeptidase
MISGFSVFANDGRRNSATPILKVSDSNGKVYDDNRPQNSPVLDPQVARKVNSILSDNAARTPIFGSGNKLFIPGRTVAAKTGTTQEYRDAWTIGYTPYLAAGVWAGNNDNRPMRAGADGSYVAAPIWNKFMSAAIQNHSDEQFMAYDRNPDFASGKKVDITYHKKKNGKKISEEKALAMDKDKVEIRIEAGSNNLKNSKFLFPDIAQNQWLSVFGKVAGISTSRN